MKSIQDPTRIAMLDRVQIAVNQPTLCAAVPGFLRGEGIFETFLVRRGQATPLLHRHDARLARSARLTGFEIHPGELLRSFQDFSPLLDDSNWRVRLTLFRGLSEQQHFLWTAGPEPPQPESVILQITDFRLDPLDPIAGAKITSRMGLQVARQRAQAAGAYDAILRTIDGDLAEGTSSNFFLWQEGGLHTPGLNRGILGGVTRYAVLEACKKAQIPVFERRIALEELRSAVEVYITNAVIGVTPVASILEWRTQLPGSRGEALGHIREAYRSFLADCPASI